MSSFRLTPSALQDIDEIVVHLEGRSGPELAHRIRNELFAKFETLATFPGLGHSRSDLTPYPLVFHTADTYVIVYDRNVSPIIIHAVLHGQRNISQTLRLRTF